MIEDWTLFLEVGPELAVKMGTALLCGGMLGIEREMKEKTAGFRTLILITVGSTLYMIVSDLIGLTTESPAGITSVDPSRVASQVVVGIGFLGGGAIIQSQGSVRGLTTASTIWTAAAVGLCIGVGFPLLGVAITLVVLFVLVVLDPIRVRLNRRGELVRLDLTVPDDTLALSRVREALRQFDVPAHHLSVLGKREERLDVQITYWRPAQAQLLKEISAIDGVRGLPLNLHGS